MKFVKIPYNYDTEPQDVEQYRKFYKNKVKKAFVQWCAYKGLLDDVFTKSEVKQAKKGSLPSWCNIHHIRPLSGAGKENNEHVNDFTNLCIISVKLHEYINKYYFNPQIKTGKTEILVPELPQVAVTDQLFNQVKYITETHIVVTRKPLLIKKESSR